MRDDSGSAVAAFEAKVTSGAYRLIDNPCLCGNRAADKDRLLAKRERHGIQVNSLLCHRCGLIRCEQVLDPPSNRAFYADDYRKIYNDEATPQSYFDGQRRRGEDFFRLVHPFLEDGPQEVFEVGCGAGGVLQAFAEAGHRSRGCDLGEAFVTYGCSMGLDLYVGDYFETVPAGSVDLLILSHVLEHLADPFAELNRIASKIRPGGALLVEVPGVFHRTLAYYHPLLNLQNAHVIQYYYREFLEVFFTRLGFEVLFGNERCTFLLRKPPGWKEQAISEVYSEHLGAYPERIRRSLIGPEIRYRLGLHPAQWRAAAAKIITILGLRESVKRLIQRTLKKQ